MNKNSIKINVLQECGFRQLTKALNNQNQFQWYTYENKQIRPIKVIVKKLHHSCKPNDITNYLQEHGYNALEAVNKLK